MNDFLHQGYLLDDTIRFTYALTTRVANEAVLRHQCDPLSAHLLCRAITGGVLISPLLAEEERFTVCWRYNGAVRVIVVETGHLADVRGFVGTPSLMGAVEQEVEIYGTEGSVSVVRSLPRKQLGSGTAPAALLDVIDDLAYFLCTSDQQETGMTALIAFDNDEARPVRLSQGMMIQAMPRCDLRQFDALRSNMQSTAFRELLAEPPIADNHIERLARALLAGTSLSLDGFKLIDGPEPAFTCRCSREKTLPLLKTLSTEELRECVAKSEPLTIRCHFCTQAYTFGADELQRLIEQR